MYKNDGSEWVHCGNETHCLLSVRPKPGKMDEVVEMCMFLFPVVIVTEESHDKVTVAEKSQFEKLMAESLN